MIRTRHIFHSLASIGALAAGLAGAGPAFAQTAPAAGSPGSQEIIVTATRREVGAQSVPLALTAVGAEQLRDANITNASDLGRVAPSLIVQTDVSGGSPRYSLRGLSNSDTLAAGAPAVATYIDDVAQTAQYGIGASLFDLQRVEVLRGPQGTTFGKNTTGGAIAYFAQTPTNEAEGYVTGRLGFGDRREQTIEGAVNVPIVDQKLAARISFRAEDQNDWKRNIGPDGGKVGGGHTYSLRAQLRWTPDDETRVNLAGYLARRRADQPPGHAQIGANAPIDKETVEVTGGYKYSDNFNNSAVTLRIERELGTFNLTSISHYRRTRTNLTEDLDATQYDLFFYSAPARTRQYGQELRLTSDPTLPFSGLLGLYYEHDTINQSLTSNASTTYGLYPGIQLPQSIFSAVYANDPDNFGPGRNGPLLAGSPLRMWDSNKNSYLSSKSNSYAIFGNVTAKLTSDLSITAGARKTIERKTNSGLNFYYFSGSVDFNQSSLFVDPSTAQGFDYGQPLQYKLKQNSNPLTWDITANFNPSRRLLVFARVAKGFHSGGINSAPGGFPWSPFFRPNRIPVAPAQYSGETVQSYELGIKTTIAAWLRVNANVYHYDYQDQQVTSFVNGLQQTGNAGTSKVDGAELEVSATPTSRLLLAGSVSYNNARYTDYVVGTTVYTGNRLNQAPRWSGNGQITYTLPVSEDYALRLNNNWNYRSRIFFEQANTAQQSDKARLVGNLRFSLEPESGKGFGVAAFANNITNDKRLTFVFGEAYPDYAVKYFSPGATYGLDLSYRW